jgi:hypothetical protein
VSYDANDMTAAQADTQAPGSTGAPDAACGMVPDFPLTLDGCVERVIALAEARHREHRSGAGMRSFSDVLRAAVERRLPPAEAALRDYLDSLTPSRLATLATLMYIGRDYGYAEIPIEHLDEYLGDSQHGDVLQTEEDLGDICLEHALRFRANASEATRALVEKTPLADYLRAAVRLLRYRDLALERADRFVNEGR